MSVLSGLAKLGYEGIKEVDLGKLNPPDMYEDELAVMAEVRAYFQVSYKVCSPLLTISVRTRDADNSCIWHAY